MYNLKYGAFPDFEDGVETWKYLYTGDTVVFTFRDDQNNIYTHAQVNPSNLNGKSKSCAVRYLSNLVKVYNWSHPNELITYNEMLPDMTRGGEITAAKYIIGTDFLVDVCERKGTNKKYGNRVYRNADYVDDLPPSKVALDKMRKYECTPEYKEMVLKRKKWETDQLTYAARRVEDWSTFYRGLKIE